MKIRVFTSFLIIIFMGRYVTAQTESVLYSFKDGQDGSLAESGIIRDADGNLYGCTLEGGKYGYGTVYKLSKQGKTTLYSFQGKEDGSQPNSPLIRDASGNLYGMAAFGGDACSNNQGCGVIFKIDTIGRERVLHKFTGTTSDGAIPEGGLTRDAKGNFYGTTEYGGAANVGTVFKLEPGGRETVLHSFTGGTLGASDGAAPVNGVTLDPEGNMYGTTWQGGPVNAGILFRISASGTETILHTFTGGVFDGNQPLAGLIRDAHGNLYGTTDIGGASNVGTIFKIEPSGKETVLYTFSQPGDGEYPQGPLVLDAAGNLYGNNVMGGAYGGGTVFKYNLNTGQETILHNFGAPGDAQYPIGQMATDALGHLYGNAGGGTFGFGAVFEVIP